MDAGSKDYTSDSNNADGGLMQNAVTELDLAYGNVKGILATDQGVLSFLLQFSLCIYQLTGTIPLSLKVNIAIY